jgi:hypothetical protein
MKNQKVPEKMLWNLCPICDGQFRLEQSILNSNLWFIDCTNCKLFTNCLDDGTFESGAFDYYGKFEKKEDLERIIKLRMFQ